MNAAKILVVDDDRPLRHGLSQLLELAGYEVCTAEDGLEATEALAGQRFDLLLTDLKMPRMDGIELTREARRRLPWIPVIVLTGIGDLESVQEILQAGTVELVTKPFEANQMLSTIKRLLEIAANAAEG